MTSDAYDAGYAAGKDDAHVELRVWQLDDHAATCVCELCQTVRAIVEHALLAAQTPVLLPDHHIEGCARPCGEGYAYVGSSLSLAAAQAQPRRCRSAGQSCSPSS